MGVGRPFCRLSLIRGKKPPLQAALLCPPLPGGESAGGNHRWPGKEGSTADRGG